jgi:hypothetical protein
VDGVVVERFHGHRVAFFEIHEERSKPRKIKIVDRTRHGKNIGEVGYATLCEGRMRYFDTQSFYLLNRAF